MSLKSRMGIKMNDAFDRAWFFLKASMEAPPPPEDEDWDDEKDLICHLGQEDQRILTGHTLLIWDSVMEE